ncbi:hypothetical protein LXL04_014572 [Taraxacum kok-saghyz]
MAWNVRPCDHRNCIDPLVKDESNLVARDIIFTCISNSSVASDRRIGTHMKKFKTETLFITSSLKMGCIEKEKGIDGVFHRRRGAAPVKGLAVIRVLREGDRRVDVCPVLVTKHSLNEYDRHLGYTSERIVRTADVASDGNKPQKSADANPDFEVKWKKSDLIDYKKSDIVKKTTIFMESVKQKSEKLLRIMLIVSTELGGRSNLDTFHNKTTLLVLTLILLKHHVNLSIITFIALKFSELNLHPPILSLARKHIVFLHMLWSSEKRLCLKARTYIDCENLLTVDRHQVVNLKAKCRRIWYTLRHVIGPTPSKKQSKGQKNKRKQSIKANYKDQIRELIQLSQLQMTSLPLYVIQITYAFITTGVEDAGPWLPSEEPAVALFPDLAGGCGGIGKLSKLKSDPPLCLEVRLGFERASLDFLGSPSSWLARLSSFVRDAFGLSGSEFVESPRLISVSSCD